VIIMVDKSQAAPSGFLFVVAVFVY